MKAYLAYKESGVEWIGNLPSHWGAVRIKHTDEVIMGQSPSSNDYNQEQIGLPFLQGNADFTNLYPIPRIWCDTANKTSQKDDILLSVRAPVGAINIADQDYGIGRGLCAIRAKDSVSKLIFYCLSAAHEELNSIGTGSTYTAISADDVKNTYLPHPPLPEQQAIADFLDRKTAQIDTLIKKKQRQIKLLQEQRTALINQAVTKGLDPTVPMKDAGIEWLGEIPIGWEVITLKYLVAVKITDGPHETPEFVDNGIPFVSAEAVQNGKVNFNSRRGNITREQHEEYSKKCLAQRDDIFLVKSGATTGKLAYVDTDLEFGIWSPLALIRAKRDLMLSKLLFLSLGSSYFQSQIQTSWSYGTQPNIGMKVIENLKVVIPPVEEQRSLLNKLETALEKFNPLIEKAQKQIELLQEYRTALISAAVTGKIYVRE